MKKDLPIEAVKEQIERYNGNVAAVARHFGASRKTIHNRINESAILQDALRQARETMLDNAESVLYKKVLDGSTAELIFFLKTQGRSRGYIERNELDVRTRDVSKLADDELEAITQA